MEKMSNILHELTKWSLLFFVFMLIWVVFLMYDFNKNAKSTSFVASLPLLGHLWLSLLLVITSNIANHHHDPWRVWFIFLLIFRYYKTIINIFFLFRYKRATEIGNLTPSSKDVTVIIPTVGPKGNELFKDMVHGIIRNKPGRIVFSAINHGVQKELEEKIPIILEDFRNDKDPEYQDWRAIRNNIHYVNAKVANKRAQIVSASKLKGTKNFRITAMVDDSAIWPPGFLENTLPAFTDEKVGFVGTRKWVKHPQPPPYDRTIPFHRCIWNYYVSGFWNTIGGIYLIRHNFEARATNAADGGIFTVSGRTALIRTSIIRDSKFRYKFKNEYLARGWIPGKPDGIGPVKPDDDNFITRWVINHGMDIKFQYSEETTITTSLGTLGAKKFIPQCMRWSRTTMRQNPIALFIDRTIWWKWPITVWTTYLPWLYNAALIWDPLMVYFLTSTQHYKNSEHPEISLVCMIGFIWATKLIKTVAWFEKHPKDFFLYFFPIPAYPLFAYFHSLLKLWSMLTWWDISWSGRDDIKNGGAEAEPESESEDEDEDEDDKTK